MPYYCFPFCLLVCDLHVRYIPIRADNKTVMHPIIKSIILLRLSICIITTRTKPPNINLDMSSMYLPDSTRIISLVLFLISRLIFDEFKVFFLRS